MKSSDREFEKEVEAGYRPGGNDSILLVEFLKLRARQGHAIPEAAIMTSHERFRAVLLTSLTTVAGLTPLLSEKSCRRKC